MEDGGCEALEGGKVGFEGGFKLSGMCRVEIVALENLVRCGGGRFGVGGVEINRLRLVSVGRAGRVEGLPHASPISRAIRVSFCFS